MLRGVAKAIGACAPVGVVMRFMLHIPGSLVSPTRHDDVKALAKRLGTALGEPR